MEILEEPIIQDLYRSRIDGTASMIQRQDPVVHTSKDPKEGITKEQVASYEKDGFLFIPDMFTAKEVETLFNELMKVSTSKKMAESDEAITEPNSGDVRSIFRIHKLNEMFGKLARDPRILKMVRHLLGSDVYIHQSRINLKPGFAGKEFYWHSDFETWHVEDGMPNMRALSVSIALTDNNEFNGPLMLIPGSQNHFISCVGETPENHYQQSLKRQEYGVPDEMLLKVLADEGGIVAPKGKAGSVVLFDCNTMHGSNSNISPYPRSNAFFVYNSIENKLVDPFCGLDARPGFIADRDFEVLKDSDGKYS